MRLPLRSLATLVLAVGVATCADAPSVAPKPALSGKGRIALVPVFTKQAAAVYAQRATFADVQFDHVHVLITRPPNDVVVLDTIIVFTPGSPDVELDLVVDVSVTSETFNAGMDFTNNGTPVFHGDVK